MGSVADIVSATYAPAKALRDKEKSSPPSEKLFPRHRTSWGEILYICTKRAEYREVRGLRGKLALHL